MNEPAGDTSVDMIERSIDITAPLERVWDLVTDPGWWVPDDADRHGERTPGAVTTRSSEKWGVYPVQVVELRPRDYAAFRWASQFSGAPDTDASVLVAGRTTLIEFTLTEVSRDPATVRVSVVESGFAGLDAPEQVRRSGVEENSRGWTEELQSLRDRAVAAG